MGQHAEDILDGVVCEGCGEFFDDIIDGGEAPGYPRRCDACQDSAAAKGNIPFPRSSALIAEAIEGALMEHFNRPRFAYQLCLHEASNAKARKRANFDTLAGLRDHTAAKHTLRCPDCGKAVRSFDGLQQHRNAKHPKEPT